MLYSQVRRIPWCDLFDVQHGFMVESLGADAEAAALPPKQVITQVREGIRAVSSARWAARPRSTRTSRGWLSSRTCPGAAAC